MYDSLIRYIPWLLGFAVAVCAVSIATPAYAQTGTQPDLRWMRAFLIERYVQQYGYSQNGPVGLATNASGSAQESPLLRNLGTLMTLYNLFRNSNDGLLSPTRANVGDLIVLYMLFYQQSAPLLTS